MEAHGGTCRPTTYRVDGPQVPLALSLASPVVDEAPQAQLARPPHLHARQRRLEPLRDAQPHVLLALGAQLALGPLALGPVCRSLPSGLVGDETGALLVDLLQLCVYGVGGRRMWVRCIPADINL